MHLDARGAGTPTVILEAGIAATSLSWSLVQPEIAKFTRVVSYDRAGLGWSDAGPTPRTLESMFREFEALLAAAAILPPYILVGHSFGGLLMRAWTFRHPERVAGMVLIDPASLEYWGACSEYERWRLSLGAALARRGRTLSRFGIVRAALTALLHGGGKMSALIGRAAARPAMGELERLTGEIRKLPPETWPFVRAHWSRAKCLEALGAYLDCLPNVAEEAGAVPAVSGIPTIVLSAANATPAELAERESWARTAGGGRHEIVPGTDHWIPWERPDVVVAAVKALVDRARNRECISDADGRSAR
jgi:pimeloyl-ACP methyl ester carboxylesterase